MNEGLEYSKLSEELDFNDLEEGPEVLINDYLLVNKFTQNKKLELL
ncbi:MAG: hypothetical protein PHQ32_04630 [Firmicutes bacterium]|nr:hypothetical protein [Bacillota bacterium]